MVVFVKFIDKYFGTLICSILSIFKKKKKLENVKKILVIQLWGIGETVLTLPAITALKSLYPKADIHILATSRNKQVYHGNRHISKIIEVGLNPVSLKLFILKNIGKYDLAIDMEEYLNVSSIAAFFCGKYSIGYSHDSRAKLYDAKVKYNDEQHASETFLDLIRVLGPIHEIKHLEKLNYSKEDSYFIGSFLKKNVKPNDKMICVAPGAAESAKSRMWPSGRFALLCDKILENGNAKVIFIGSQNENALIESIQSQMENKNLTFNSAGMLSLGQLFCLLEKADLFIGNDSGPMHIAAAQGTRTIGLFGPNLPARFGPFGKGNIGLYKGQNCKFSPCINVHKGQVPDCLYSKNSDDYQKCMKNISVEDVLGEVRF